MMHYLLNWCRFLFKYIRIIVAEFVAMVGIVYRIFEELCLQFILYKYNVYR